MIIWKPTSAQMVVASIEKIACVWEKRNFCCGRPTAIRILASAQ